MSTSPKLNPSAAYDSRARRDAASSADGALSEVSARTKSLIEIRERSRRDPEQGLPDFVAPAIGVEEDAGIGEQRV